MKWLKRAAKSGDADAMYQLGVKCKRDKNDEEALKWLKRAAEKGHQYAVNDLDRHQKEEAIRKGAKNRKMIEAPCKSLLTASRLRRCQELADF